MSCKVKGLFHEAKLKKSLDAIDAAPLKPGSVASEKGAGVGGDSFRVVDSFSPPSR